MLQKIRGINLTTTETAPGAKGGAKFFVLKKSLKVTTSEVGVQLREVHLQVGLRTNFSA